ncbi:active breakpoint cluster region-related protein-like [Chiloscyllium punctatum]|uniref:active breakpoint cluster region-related protein-like n=1 Tax=Chiloscyllium punctatum TaxID=137246 RepID=UPI003B63378C
MLEKCIHSKEQFKHIAENMRLKSTKESKGSPVTSSLDVLLHKPVNHVTRVTLLMRELLNNTPENTSTSAHWSLLSIFATPSSTQQIKLSTKKPRVGKLTQQRPRAW